MKLPASVPPPIELNDGLFTLLLSGQTTERQEDKEQRDLSKNPNTAQFINLKKVMERLSEGLRVKLNVNISSQVWFVIAADLKKERHQ